jgi:hypothetical protein
MQRLGVELDFDASGAAHNVQAPRARDERRGLAEG